MATLAAELEPAGPSISEYLAIGKRRMVPMLIALAAGLVTSALLAILLPAQYRSTATILIEQQELPSDLVQSTVTSYADERVQTISQRVMTVATLLRIIRRYDLYPHLRATEPRDRIIKRMRHDIGVKMISASVIDPRTGQPTKASIAFTVSFTNHSPDQAAKVANELTTLFLNKNVETRTKLADGVATFLTAQVAQVGRHLTKIESQLSAFDARHFKSLPELTQLNMGLIDRTGQQLQDAETRENSLEDQQVFLQAQLAQLKPDAAIYSDTGMRILSTPERLKMLRSKLAADQAAYGPKYPDIGRLTREIDGLRKIGKDPTDIKELRRSLDAARAKLAAVEKRYGPQYPDRRRLEREVKSYEADLATAAKAAAASKGAASSADLGDADNPAYVQIRAQLNATGNDLVAVKAREAKLRADLDRYQRRVMETPLIQKRYQQLRQNYEVTSNTYANLRGKLAAAEIGKNLEIDRKGGRFTLIEPPLVPDEPVSPNRPLVMILGAVLSVLLAAGVAALLEALDGTVRSRRDLVLIVGGIPPLAIIPDIKIERPSHEIWTRRAALGALCLAAAIGGALAVNFFYEPLDVLWFVILRHLGLG